MIQKRAAVVPAAAAMALLVWKSEAVTAGAGQALALCRDVLIPATFPFMVLSAIGAEGVDGRAGGRKNRLAGLFGISGAGLPVVLLSLIGGYPVGAAMAGQCAARGKISPGEGARLCCFCFNAGPGFVVGAVGTALLGSPVTGAVLYAALCLASLTTGVLLGFFGKEKEMVPQPDGEDTVSLVQTLTRGVRLGSENMLQVAAWVVLFGALSGLVPPGLGQTAKGLLACLAEISGGMARAVRWLPLPAAAAFLSFGGLCTHCQVMSLVRGTGLTYRRFLMARCAAAGLAAAFAWGMFRLFPAAAVTRAMASTVNPVLSYAGVPTAVSLLFMCVIFVLGLDIREKV